MEKLTILNTILVWGIIIYLITKPLLQYYAFAIGRDYLGKAYEFGITKWKFKKGTLPNKGISKMVSFRKPNSII
jgi:hypothetical protein